MYLLQTENKTKEELKQQAMPKKPLTRKIHILISKRTYLQVIQKLSKIILNN